MAGIGIDPANTTVLITDPKSTSSGPKASSGTGSASPDSERGSNRKRNANLQSDDGCVRDDLVPCRHRQSPCDRPNRSIVFR